MAARKRGTAHAVALPARRGTLAVRRLLPSVRSIGIGLALLGLGAGAYAGALETSVFAVRHLAIAGGTPRAQAEVRAALAPELGRSLLRVNGADLAGRTAAIPDVISLRFDRAFPHTLRVSIKAERAVILLRRVNDTWVVSSRGRVLRRLRNPARSSLPRVWVPKGTPVSVGETLPRDDGGLAAAAVAPIANGAFPAGAVRFVLATKAELTLKMRSGLEIRLGDIGDLRLKLAIANRILHTLTSAPPAGAYIDVSVPERPVFGT